jgi:hypothetical protein
LLRNKGSVAVDFCRLLLLISVALPPSMTIWVLFAQRPHGHPGNTQKTLLNRLNSSTLLILITLG